MGGYYLFCFAVFFQKCIVFYKPYSDDDADLTVYVELASMEGSSIPCDLALKINLYTENDELYMAKHVYIEEDIFDGYDTVTIECYDSKHTLERAKKGRLYVVRD